MNLNDSTVIIVELGLAVLASIITFIYNSKAISVL